MTSIVSAPQLVTVAFVLFVGSIAVGVATWVARRLDRVRAEETGLRLLEASDTITALTHHVENETRRRIEVVEMISEALRERDQWRQLYWDSGTQHSAAQQQMFDEIVRLCRKLRAHKIDFRDKTSEFGNIVGGYREKYGQATGPENPIEAAGNQSTDRQPKTTSNQSVDSEPKA